MDKMWDKRAGTCTKTHDELINYILTGLEHSGF